MHPHKALVRARARKASELKKADNQVYVTFQTSLVSLARRAPKATDPDGQARVAPSRPISLHIDVRSGPSTYSAPHKRAYGGRLVDTPIAQATIWTLRRGDRVASAQVRAIKDVGLDLRFLADGVLRETRVFTGTAAETDVVDLALMKRAELEANGWRAHR